MLDLAQNRRLLVIDDTRAIHDDFRKILCAKRSGQDLLDAAGDALFGATAAPPPALAFELDSAYQGEEGLALVRKALERGRPYALAFVDVRMPPGWDGIETIERIWQIAPELQMVICTAYSDYAWDQMIAKLGHSDRLLILKKPFDTVEVLQLAAALTEKWRLTQQARATIADLELMVQARSRELATTMEQLAQARKMEAVGRLAGGVAHDYNNVLTATLLQLGLLIERTDLAPSTRAALQELEQMANRSARLTRQLLAFSRQQVMRKAPVNLNDALQNLLAMLRPLLGENIEVVFQMAETAPLIEADVGMIEQLVTNLCVNARDAMLPRGGRLTLRTGGAVLDALPPGAPPEARPGQYVFLSIADTGCGMDAGTLAHVFEPFFTTKGYDKGTGLGLASVHGIAQQHLGWVEVESELGGGSVFRIMLPALTDRAVVPAAPVAPAKKHGHETILLVEDEDPVRLVLGIALRHCGYQVHEACDGKEAAEQWTERLPEVDLLISDMVMPNGMSGLELFDHFQRAKPDLRAIIASGYSVKLNRLEPLNRPGVEYLAKPFTIETITGMVRKCLDAVRPPR